MKKLITMLIAVCITTLQVSDCFANSFSLFPDADTFINMGAVTNPPTITNIGTATRLEVKDVETGVINNDKISYMRFNLSNVTGSITKASLKIVFKGVASTTLVPKISLYKVADDAWKETSLAETWTSRTDFPLALGDKIGSDYDISVSVNNPIIIDVTDYIKEEYEGDGIATFAITGCNDQRLTIEFYSKDYNTNTDYKPSLNIETVKPVTIDESKFVDGNGTVIHKLFDCTNEVNNEITITNNSMGITDLSLILALYNKKGDLQRVAYQNAENVNNGDTISLKAGVALGEDFNGYSAKAFLWDGISSMQPIAACVTLPYDTEANNSDIFSADSIEYALGGVSSDISDCVQLTEPINSAVNPITIKGVNKQGENKKVSILITEDGKQAENTESIFYIDQVVTDKEGNFKFSVNAPQIELSKDYDVYIGAQNLTGVLTTGFSVYNINTIINYIKKSNNAEYLKNNVFLKNEYREIFLKNGFLLNEFSTLGDRINLVCDLIYNNSKSEEFDVNTLKAFFNKTVVTQMINNVSRLPKEEQKAAIENIINLHSNILMFDSANEWIINKIVNKIPSLSSNYIEILILLDKINTGRYTIISLLSDQNNAKTLGLINSTYYQKYIDMTEDYKEKVHKDIFIKRPYESQSELESAFNDAVAANLIHKKDSPKSDSKSTRSINISNITPKSVPDVSTVPQEENDVAFTDVSRNHWAYEYIQTLVKKGIASGWDSQFRPQEKIKREEFLKMLLGVFNLKDEKYDCDFNDVDKFAWYYSFVSSAYTLGITKGESDSTFGIGKEITREDTVVQINRVALLMKLNLGNANEIVDFIDSKDIAGYAADSVVVMQKAGIINGNEENLFKPKEGLTRAEAAKVIVELMKFQQLN